MPEQPFGRALPPLPVLLVLAACIMLLPSMMPSRRWLYDRPGIATHMELKASSGVDGCVVIVHLGDGSHVAGIPMQQTAQIVDNVEQIRLFNPTIAVYLVVSANLRLAAAEAARLAAAKAVLVITDTLQPTPEHEHWQQHSNVAKNADRNFFWRYASERFFYLSDVAVQRNLTNIIHIEYDTLIYIDLSRILPVLQRLYPAGGVFDNPRRCIPGFMFFSGAKSVLQLAKFMSERANKSMNDMEAVAQYRIDHPDRILPLPLFDPATYPDPVDKVYATHLQELGCVFDGAAYGQYLGGVDPRNMAGNSTGFVNEACLVKPDKLKFEWREERGLLVPYMNGLPIANLHIHSKNTTRFRSDRDKGHGHKYKCM